MKRVQEPNWKWVGDPSKRRRSTTGRSEIEEVGCKALGAVSYKAKQKNGYNMTIIPCTFVVANIIKIHNNSRC